MRPLLPILLAVAVVGCSGGDQPVADRDATATSSAGPGSPPLPAATSPATATGTPTTTGTPPTTTGTLPPTGDTGATATEPSGPGPAGVRLHLPEDPSGAPIAVLVHGGGWVAGSPHSMEPLAEALANRGMVVFNASYRTGRDGGGYPASFDDVACAMRYARERGDELGTSDAVTLVGHSAGAHLSSVVALSEETFGTGCDWAGSSTPDRLVGLAGIYRPDTVAPVMELFLGGDRDTAAEAWEAADPFTHLAAADAFSTLLVHGLADRIVPAEASEGFAEALGDAGADALVRLVDGGHNDVLSAAVSADLIAGRN